MLRPALALAIAASLALACGERSSAPSATPAAAAVGANAATPAAAPASAKPARQEKPLPAFDGVTLSGQRVSAANFLGKRLLVFFFNPEVAEAKVAGRAVTAVKSQRAAHNFEILGVGMGAERAKIESFVREFGLDFPVIDDASGTVLQRVGLRAPVALVGVDSEGYVVFLLGGFPSDGPNPSGAAEAQLRQALRLAESGATEETGLGAALPRAPEFTAARLDGGEPFRLAEQRGKPMLLVFFLHTCPHCHHLLQFLKTHLPTLPEDKRPLLVGVSVSDRSDAVRSTLKNDGLDFFPVLTDPDFKLRSAYGVVAGVPDTFLIDGEGRIAAHVQGWRDDRDPPLMKMRIAKVTGMPVPMLLHQTGFSGTEFCAVCHTQETETWELTSHAAAFPTLVKHGVDKDPECVSCHVVGWNKVGGYTLNPATPALENVGCESCHGRGGPHLSPGLVKDGSYEAQCLQCHDAKHSLGFAYADFLPRVSHREVAKIAALPPAEKQKILAARRAPRENLLPTSAAYVGSAACQTCHAAEHATWSKGAHARALESLAAKGKAESADCLKCHTTGFGRPGGFPADGKPSAHPGLSNVGCESCHGPGGDHVKEGAARVGTIVSLGDKCDSCAVMQVCGACHDDANDPGFEFEHEKKIAAQKHGTIEPAATKGKKPAGTGG